MKQLREYVCENNFFKNLGIGQRALIEKWLKEHNIKKYTINDDMTIDVKGNVDLWGYEDGEEFPDYIQFGTVKGIFNIAFSELTTLRGCPKKCICFNCENSVNLRSLDFAPSECEEFFCHNCGRRFTKEYIESISKSKKGKMWIIV